MTFYQTFTVVCLTTAISSLKKEPLVLFFIHLELHSLLGYNCETSTIFSSVLALETPSLSEAAFASSLSYLIATSKSSWAHLHVETRLVQSHAARFVTSQTKHTSSHFMYTVLYTGLIPLSSVFFFLLAFVLLSPDSPWV